MFVSFEFFKCIVEFKLVFKILAFLEVESWHTTILYLEYSYDTFVGLCYMTCLQKISY